MARRGYRPSGLYGWHGYSQPIRFNGGLVGKREWKRLYRPDEVFTRVGFTLRGDGLNAVRSGSPLDFLFDCPVFLNKFRRMKYILALLLTCVSAFSETNVLELVWTQPPGYSSTLYTATNISGAWTPLAIPSNQPPVSITATQSQAFFYVVVSPPQNMAGSGDPHLNTPMGVTYVNTNTGDFWINLYGGTNGWNWYIAGGQ